MPKTLNFHEKCNSWLKSYGADCNEYNPSSNVSDFMTMSNYGNNFQNHFSFSCAYEFIFLQCINNLGVANIVWGIASTTHVLVSFIQYTSNS